jgi:CRISPR-associated endonuclease/helicase Cas3
MARELLLAQRATVMIRWRGNAQTLRKAGRGALEMKGAITTFWGKLSEDRLEWNPLLHHCADVAACCEALLQRTVLGERLAAWGDIPALDEVQVERLSAIAALHDVGKFNNAFQAKAQPKKRGKGGHVLEILAMFGAGYEDVQARLIPVLPLGDFERWADNDVACKLLVAAIGHHGRPYPCESREQINADIWGPGRLGDPLAGIADLVAAVRRWFPRAFEPGGARLPTSAAFQHGFAGLVMLADWLGSHRGLFPYSAELEPDRMPLARGQALHALAAVGLDVVGPRGSLGPTRPSFATISEHPEPAPAQAVTEALPCERGGSLTILEAETGSGKTEAALLRFAQLFHAGCVDGLFFALPTRTAATQIHRRVLAAMERAFPADQRPPVVLAVPGYLRVDDVEGERLPHFEVLWNDDDRERFRYRGWAAENSKRYLAGSIVVGTIDQLLLSAVMVPHAHLRATAAARHLVVVDEVHASDAYMNRLLEEVLRFQLQSGGHAFLMSATLGSSARTRLLDAVGAGAPAPSLVAASDMPYPMITHFERGRGVELRGVQHGKRHRTIRPIVHPIAADPRAVASLALAAARQGARVLVVRNLVKDCIATQEALEALAEETGESALLFRAEGVVAPHHSRFARDDRRCLDAAVEREFGKSRVAGSGRVLIATQTVEQSLDLDADLLLTDLCPMDVLLQRVGRLHRHERERPGGFELPTVRILVPTERDLGRWIQRDGTAQGPHGLGTVYEDLRVLETTWRLCGTSAQLEIPADNRRLVEATTHPEALAAVVGDLGGPWQHHAEAMRGQRATDRGIAKDVLVVRTAEFGEVRFKDRDEVGKVASRLGEDDRTVTFTEGQTSPFGQVIETVIVPHPMLRGSQPDPLAPVAATGDAGVIKFRYGDAAYRYDRLGLRT